VLGGQSGLSEQTARGFLRIIYYLRFLAKVFEKILLPGGQSAGTRRTVHYLPRNQIDRCAARVDRVDGPWPARGQSAGAWRTVRPAQRAVLTAVDFAFLPLELKRGQSARASQTVHEVRVFHITASNGKRGYLYSMPELGEALLAL
jgi:hypothetical protein